MSEVPPDDEEKDQLSFGLPSYDFGDSDEPDADDESDEEESSEEPIDPAPSGQSEPAEVQEVEEEPELKVEEELQKEEESPIEPELEAEEVNQVESADEPDPSDSNEFEEQDVVKKKPEPKAKKAAPKLSRTKKEEEPDEEIIVDEVVDASENPFIGGDGEPPESGDVGLASHPDDPEPLKKRVDQSFLEYASYVIRDRAIPHLIDGLKPVQRRIMWSLKKNDDGKFIKVANIVGYTMQFHPHGDASIGDALVVLTNKRYLIEGQGNFGNIFTGDRAAASRYIECRLTELARNELFNDELTEFIPSYDGRNKEPVVLPSKLPMLLMLGAEGIAVGLSSKILPHNFIELLEAQVDILRKKPVYLVPDFPVNCQMDASQYDDGRGSIKLRARIKIKSENTLMITAISPTSTTESLINSIEDASKKGKIKVKSINDYTSEKIEIEIKLPPGVKAEKTIPALYAFTDCETSISSRIVVIRDNRPVEMSVTQILRFNTMMLKEFLKRELEIAEHKLNEELHFKTLVQIFVENRIYKMIEECRTNDAVVAAIYKGFEPFKKKLIRAINDADIEKLLAVHIRRISLFDINKHRDEMEKLLKDLAEVRKNLGQLTRFTVRHLKGLIKKYKDIYPRMTEIVKNGFAAVNAKEVAIKALKVAYDRDKGYIGHKVTGGEFQMECSKFDKLVMIFDDGMYKVVGMEEKLYVGSKLLYCAHPDKDQEFTIAYESKGVTYVKRFKIGGFIMNRDYQCAPEKSKIRFFGLGSPEKLFITYKPAPYQRVNEQWIEMADISQKGVKARGNQVSIKKVKKITEKQPRNWNEDGGATRVRFA